MLQVLVFDDPGQDVLSQLLTVGELRELGVTLHLGLNSARQPIPGFCFFNERDKE